MNYTINKSLTPEQVKEKKENLKIPDGPHPFVTDIIDQMSLHENTMIFNMKSPNYHDSDCKAMKTDGAPCC